ncbi:hypothetical protein FrCorBMG51_16005 [Protofrankia coriariae]|uniref:Phosphoglycerate kinase n=1 Tax=Protofrankia coriariae TaxID=1562887 RepID=A0ABR5F1W8_9ACTN|nr:hypothetical protein FrCorBMG51_16005 [Protofrankia coriariae]
MRSEATATGTAQDGAVRADQKDVGLAVAGVDGEHSRQTGSGRQADSPFRIDVSRTGRGVDAPTRERGHFGGSPDATERSRVFGGTDEHGSRQPAP